MANSSDNNRTLLVTRRGMAFRSFFSFFFLSFLHSYVLSLTAGLGQCFSTATWSQRLTNGEATRGRTDHGDISCPRGGFVVLPSALPVSNRPCGFCGR